MTLLEQLKEKLKWGGVRAAASHYYKYRNSPATAAVRTDMTLLAVADYLKAEKRQDDAVDILRRAVEEYPDSACNLALGKGLVEKGGVKGRSSP